MSGYFHFSSSDEDLEELLELVTDSESESYFEETVPEFSDEEYVQHFRVSRSVSQDLAERFEASNHIHYQSGNSLRMSALKCITVFLSFAANQAESYRVVSDRFNISQSCLFKIVETVTIFISNLSPEIIKWPTDEEKEEIEAYFRSKNFPGTIGVIDGVHFKIDKPSEDPTSYLNSKKFYSIQAQLVCDHRKKIRDIFVGYPGSVNDSRILRASPLYESLNEKCSGYFILGDGGYPCLKNLLTPFKDFGQLTRRQINYNYLLTMNRYTIEHCSSIMKQKFRYLYNLKFGKITTTVNFIRACAVLHNLSIENDLAHVGEELVDESVNIRERRDYLEDDRDGVRRRLEVMNDLPLILHGM